MADLVASYWETWVAAHSEKTNFGVAFGVVAGSEEWVVVFDVGFYPDECDGGVLEAPGFYCFDAFVHKGPY